MFRKALAGLGYPPNEITASQPMDAALIRAIYAERRAENGGRYFPSSPQNIRASVVNRFHNEEADALRSLQQEIDAANIVTCLNVLRNNFENDVELLKALQEYCKQYYYNEYIPKYMKLDCLLQKFVQLNQIIPNEIYRIIKLFIGHLPIVYL